MPTADAVCSTFLVFAQTRAVARSEILGGLVVLGGDNVSPLVEIGLTDPPKSGGAAAPSASHLAACLEYGIDLASEINVAPGKHD